MENEDLLTIREVQEWLKVSRATVYKLIDSGEIQRIKLSPKAARVTAESVRGYLGRCAA